MTYRYYCTYVDFGCTFNRTRRNAIMKHNVCCSFAQKFKKYVDAVQENIFLKQRIKRMEKSMLLGRPCLRLTPIDTDGWSSRFWSSDLKSVFCKMCPSAKYAVKGLIVFLINTSDRFYKVLSSNTIEFIGKINLLDTFGEREIHNLSDVTQHLFNWASDMIYDQPKLVNLSEEALDKGDHYIDDFNVTCNEKHRIFIFNTLRADVARRRQPVGAPIKFRGVSVTI